MPQEDIITLYSERSFRRVKNLLNRGYNVLIVVLDNGEQAIYKKKTKDGLAAGKLLHEQGLDVLVLEARDRVGGRTYTIRNPNVNYVDLGGAYVGPTQNRLLRMAKEFGVKTMLTNEVEKLAYHRNGRTKQFKASFPPMGSFLAYLDMNNLFRLLDKMGEEVPMEAPWKAPHAEEWDKITMQEFFNQNVWTEGAMMFVRQFIKVNVTSEPYEVSLLWFVWYVKGAGGPQRIYSTSNGGQERKFVGGSQQISIRMAEKIGLGERVLLKKPIVKLENQDSGVTVQDIDGARYTAKYAILALAPPLQNKITYDPPLTTLRNQLLQRIPMGSVIKTFTYYSTPFWKAKGFCGSSAIDDEGAIIGFTIDDTKPDGSHPAIMGFILADKAKRFSNLTKEERRDKIAHLYSKVFQSPEALQPIHYEEMNWLAEPWSGGCYTTYMPPGFFTHFGRELRKPWGRVYFAGTETATEWSGYMEGGIQAGERAAREILFRMGKINENEIWKSEPEDTEVVALPFETTFWERNLPSVPGFLRLMSLTSILSAASAGAFIYHKYYR